jgi:hypothetical protein
MNSTLAKLIALKDRVTRVQGIHRTPPSDIFVNLRDQFLKEVDKLKAEYDDLQDFTPQNYEQFQVGQNAYYSWATRALIADIEYYVNYLTNIESVQTLKVKVSEEGIYFAGQHFDALLKFNDIISKAKKEIILIDSYINEKILEILASKNSAVSCRVLTLDKSLSPSIKAFIDVFNKQYKNLEVKTSSAFHDRFVVIDQNDFYHFGASIKDVGNKGFMFSKIEQDFIKAGILEKIETEWEK